MIKWHSSSNKMGTKEFRGGALIPIVVDKEQIKVDILEALVKCIEKKHLVQISMRDIAKQAKMSHTKILYYYPCKKDLIREYCNYIADLYIKKVDEIIANTQPACSKSELYEGIIDAFYSIEFNEIYTNSFIQIYSMGLYDNIIREIVQKTYSHWMKAIGEALAFTDQKEEVAQAIFVLLEGVLLYSLNATLTKKDALKIFSVLCDTN